jgi:DNA polymerase zeta
MFYTKGLSIHKIASTFEPEPIESTLQLSSSSALFSLPRASYNSEPGSQFLARPLKGQILVYAPPPPSTSELLSTLEQSGLPRRIYRDPFYSKKADVPDGPREYAGLVYRLKGGGGLDTLEEWRASENHISSSSKVTRLSVPCSGWEYASTPPSVRQIRKWLEENPLKPGKPVTDNSQVVHTSVALRSLNSPPWLDCGADASKRLWTRVLAGKTL